MEDEADRCQGCGEPLHESTDPNADPNNPYATERYVASNPLVCFSCAAKDSAKDKLLKANKWLKGKTILLATKKVGRKPLSRRS